MLARIGALVIGRRVTRLLTPSHGPNECVEQRRLDMVVDEIGPSLAWATAVVTKPAPLLTASRPTEHRVWVATSSPMSEGAVTSVVYAA
jgi:hypothetical protein